MNKNWNGRTRSVRRTPSEMAGSTAQVRPTSALPLSTESIPRIPVKRSGYLSRILGVDELAVYFNCSTAKIKRRARAGELPAFKFGKSWFVREDDLELYIQQMLESNLVGRTSASFSKMPLVGSGLKPRLH
jgi:excisionase family DNA binding protein